ARAATIAAAGTRRRQSSHTDSYQRLLMIPTVDLTPGMDWQAAVDAASPGTHFRVRAGTHRQGSVAPKISMRFTGEPGAVLTGARVLPASAFQATGGAWAIGGQTQASPIHGGACQQAPGFPESWPGCDFNEELFVDHVRQ